MGGFDGGKLTSTVILGAEFKSFPNTFFESMSGFTTTGATSLNVNGINVSMVWAISKMGRLPSSQYYVAIGDSPVWGDRIVVLGVAILPVLASEVCGSTRRSPGPMNDRFTPRVGRAKILWKIYGLITLTLALFSGARNGSL